MSALNTEAAILILASNRLKTLEFSEWFSYWRPQIEFCCSVGLGVVDSGGSLVYTLNSRDVFAFALIGRSDGRGETD